MITGFSAFYLGKLLSYDNGYFAGAIFGDSSGFKRGYGFGYERGYWVRDSAAARELSNISSEQLNLSLIYEEAGYPSEFINVSAELLSKEAGSSYFTENFVTYVKLTVFNKARFARYKDIVVHISFFNKRSKLLETLNVEINEILNPGKSSYHEISHDKVPRSTEQVKCKLLKATAID